MAAPFTKIRMSNEELKSYVEHVVKRQAERYASHNKPVKRSLRFEHSPVPMAKFKSSVASSIRAS
jgi:hypothetical protein